MAKLLLGVVAFLAAFSIAAFDGFPTAPQDLNTHADYALWDVQIHERSMQATGGNVVPSMQAQHGANCSGPPDSHTSSTAASTVYICNEHLMTAINGTEYGLIVLTPNRVLDFSTQGVVEFDLSTQRMSTRDWWDVTLSPFGFAQALPLLCDLCSGVPDLQGANPDSIVIEADDLTGSLDLKVARNGTDVNYSGTADSIATGVVAGTNQAAVRQRFRLTMTPTSVKFERLASGTADARVFINQSFAALSWTSGVLQIGHHSYNPAKDGSGVPATWHWDEVTLAPSTTFTIIKSATRWTRGGSIQMGTGAPASAFLRFSALCRPVVTVSGQQPVTLTKMSDTGHPEHASSYQMPMPAGAHLFSVSFVADEWFQPGGHCIAKDFHVWAPQTAPTPTPSPTPTPLPATSTPTVQPTATSTSTSTPTPSPTPTVVAPSPTSTATPTSTVVSPTSTPTPSGTPTFYDVGACVPAGVPLPHTYAQATPILKTQGWSC